MNNIGQDQTKVAQTPENPITRGAAYHAGYKEARKRLDLTGAGLVEEALGEAMCWVSCYRRGERGFTPQEHATTELLSPMNIFAVGFVARVEAE